MCDIEVPAHLCVLDASKLKQHLAHVYCLRCLQLFEYMSPLGWDAVLCRRSANKRHTFHLAPASPDDIPRRTRARARGSRLEHGVCKCSDPRYFAKYLRQRPKIFNRHRISQIRSCVSRAPSSAAYAASFCYANLEKRAQTLKLTFSERRRVT